MSLVDREAEGRADLATCRETLRAGSRTFLAASFALPRDVSDHACALYAFCRMADDEFDLNAGGIEALARLHDRLDRIYGRRPLPIAADRAFADVVSRFGIPRALPEALLEGFAWDAEGRRYETLSGLKAYAVRVAGTVGAMMAMLMGQRAPDVVACACELGVAMQLTNIARDVGEDARAGRLYLPQQWLREAGIDPEAFLARPEFTDAIGAIVRRLLRVADFHYAGSRTGIAQLPAACRSGIQAARILYAEIGREVERNGCDSISRRAVVSPTRKSMLLAKVMAAVIVPARSAPPAPLPEASFLIDAVVAAPAVAAWRSRHNATPWWDVESRMVWLIDLFERLERREQAERM